MRPSYISNSKTLESIPWPTKPVLIAFVLLGIVRGLFILEPEPLYPLARDENEVYFQLNEALHLGRLASKSNEIPLRPRLVVLGSSRHFELPVFQMARALNLERSDIEKCATPANSYFSTSQLVERNPEIVRHCEVAIIDILPGQLDVPLESPELTPLRLQRTTLKQKVLFTQPGDRVLAHADFIFPFLSMAYSSREWFLGLNGTSEEIDQANLELLNESLRAMKEEVAQKTNIQVINKVLRREFPSGLHSPLDRRSLFDLLNSFPPETSILLVRPPYRDDIEYLIRHTPDRAKSQEEFRKLVESIDRPNVELLWIESASNLGLSDEDYNDDGAHLSKSGLKILADHYIDLIRERDLLNLP